jgi:xanthine dehydrogenase YagS FAD-binding subunit
MQSFEYANPATTKEALGLLADRWGEVDLLAGGTDLLALMKDYVHTPRRVVDIKGIKELGGIGKTTGGLRIGATVTLDELLASPLVRQEFPSLSQAARGVASMQIRNMGTIGGDLCQRPRCWYFRLGYGLLPTSTGGRAMALDGDNRYHAIFGGGPAYFVSASSFGPALAALGAKVRIASASGQRELPVEQFFLAPKDEATRETALRPNEILTAVVVPLARTRNATYEIRQQEALDWPLATASVALQMKGTAIASARVVLGHLAPTPWVASQAERMLAGKTITDDVAGQAGEAAVAGAAPLSKNGYKVQLARVAVKRALLLAARGKV